MKGILANTHDKNTIAAVLAILFGTFGIHKFYLGEFKSGILYLLFCWTGIPAILAILDFVNLLINENNEGK